MEGRMARLALWAARMHDDDPVNVLQQLDAIAVELETQQERFALLQALAPEIKIDEFDFIGASMPWKLEWTTRVRQHANCYIFRKGPFGRMLHAAKFQVDTRVRSFAHRPRVARLRALLTGADS